MDNLEASRADTLLLDELTLWLSEMETMVKQHSQKEIPENIPIVEQLLQDHAVHIYLFSFCCSSCVSEISYLTSALIFL